MSEYMNAATNAHLIGKRARVKPLKNYATFLHGKTGVIDEVNEIIHLKFDTPAKRDEHDCFPMNGVYLTEEAFELEV